jgi:hypothetical protein
MDMDNESVKRKYLQNLSDAELDDVIKQLGAGSRDGQIAREILTERRTLPQRQFEKTFQQTEQHHQDLLRSGRIPLAFLLLAHWLHGHQYGFNIYRRALSQHRPLTSLHQSRRRLRRNQRHDETAPRLRSPTAQR